MWKRGETPRTSGASGSRSPQRGAGPLKQCFTILGQVDEQMFDGFSPEEQEQLNSYHRRMLQPPRQ